MRKQNYILSSIQQPSAPCSEAISMSPWHPLEASDRKIERSED